MISDHFTATFTAIPTPSQGRSTQPDLRQRQTLKYLHVYAHVGVRPLILSVLSALAEPKRLQAVRLLAEGTEPCIWDLMTRLGSGPRQMCRHLRVLRQAGLVIDRREGPWDRYRFTPHLSLPLLHLVTAALADDLTHTFVPQVAQK